MLLRLGGAVLVLLFACLWCAVSCRVLRVLWLACRCRSAVSGGWSGLARASQCWSVPSGAAGLVRHNTPVFAGMSQRAPAPREASLAPCLPLVGVRRKGILVSVEDPLSSLDVVKFSGLRGMCASHHSRRLHVPNLPQRPKRLTFSEEVRAGPSGARIP